MVAAATDEDIMVGLLLVLATIRRRPPLSYSYLFVFFVLAGREIVCLSHSVEKYRIRLSVSSHRHWWAVDERLTDEFAS